MWLMLAFTAPVLAQDAGDETVRQTTCQPVCALSSSAEGFLALELDRALRHGTIVGAGVAYNNETDQRAISAGPQLCEGRGIPAEVQLENDTGQSGRSIGAPERNSNVDSAKPSTDELSVTDDATLPDGDAPMARSSASKQSTEEAEHALLVGISAGDRSAMDQLYLLYFARLAHFFWHLTAPADDVEELINDTMFEGWREGASIRANASSVAIMGLAYLRGQKLFAEASASRSHDRGPKQHAEHDGSNPRQILRELPVEERAVLHFVYAGGHSRQDIADITKISCGDVDALLGNARRGYLLTYIRTDNTIDVLLQQQSISAFDGRIDPSLTSFTTGAFHE